MHFRHTGSSFFRFMVSGKGLRMDREKAKSILDWPRPTNKKEVRQILELWNFYRRFVPGYAEIVSPITDVLRRLKTTIEWGKSQEAAVLKIVVHFTSGKAPILRHYDPNRPALVETDALDFAIAGILSRKFEDRKLHPASFNSRKLSPTEFNYDVYDKEMLAVVYCLTNWRYFLQGAIHKTIVYSDHQNLTYFKTAVSLNRRQARWAEDLVSFNFDLYYRKGSANQKADILSRCLAFTSREGGTTATGNKLLLRKEQWLEIGAMQLDDNGREDIYIGALDIDQMLPEAKERIKEKALLDDSYISICKQLSSGDVTDKHYELVDHILCWKKRI